jgi:hypothetical protein
MATKKPTNPALEKREERVHRDLDHDGERGESAAHRKKVLGPADKKAPARQAAPKKAAKK